MKLKLKLQFGQIVGAMFIALSSNLSMASILPTDGRVDIWPTIPFMRGADLCAYKDALGKSKTEYMSQMIGFATQLMEAGASGSTALQMLVQFNKLHELNVRKATQYLDITLEASLKSYLDQYYRDINPTVKRISFTHVEDIRTIVNLAIKNQRNGVLTDEMLARLDYVGYATYSLAPNCDGTVQVTLHLVGKNGQTKSYIALGEPAFVMSQIATQMFTEFQRTRFPVEVSFLDKKLTLIGDMNGNVGSAPTWKQASFVCMQIGARLPTADELDYIGMIGDWSGGVALGQGRVYWAIDGNKIFAPFVRPQAVRETDEHQGYPLRFYCVK